MPVNKTGGYSGREIKKAHNGLGQDGISGTRTLNGHTQTKVSNATPPKTTGSAPNFQNSGNGSNTSGNKPK